MTGRVQGCFQMQFEGVIETCAVVRHVVYAKRRDWAEGSSSMDFQDKVLKCIDCGNDFIFTAGEQLFFHDKQFKNEPKRCKSCKGKRVAVLGAVPAQAPTYRYTKVETQAMCSGCGKQTTVPF